MPRPEALAWYMAASASSTSRSSSVPLWWPKAMPMLTPTETMTGCTRSVMSMTGVPASAASSGERMASSGQQQGLLDRVDEPLGDGDGLGLVAQLAAQHAELVAAESGRQVAGSQHPLDAAGDLGQHVVAGPVPVVVVDGLEAVEVEVEHGHQVAVAVQLAGQVAEELGPVGQAGEGVVAGRVQQQVLGVAPLEGQGQQPARPGRRPPARPATARPGRVRQAMRPPMISVVPGAGTGKTQQASKPWALGVGPQRRA